MSCAVSNRMRRSIYICLSLFALMGQYPLSAQGFPASGQYIGSENGDHDYVDMGATGICEKTNINRKWTVSLGDFDAVSKKGDAKMTFEESWDVTFSPGAIGGDKANCYRDATGRSDGASGKQTVNYEGNWHPVAKKPRSIYIDLKAIDCNGDKCGMLGSIFRQVDVYASGDLMYSRNGVYSPVRLVHQ